MNEPKKIDEWIALLGERSLSESETHELRELLRNSPEALDKYLDHCDLETWLAAAGDLGRATETSDLVSLPEAKKRFESRKFWAAAAVVSALLGGGIFFWASNRSTAETSSLPLTEESVGSEKEIEVAESTDSTRDPWKVINSTGSVKHPGIKDKAVPAMSSNRPIKFNRDIRPILSETCFHCHGPDEHGRRADLRLDSLAGATTDLGGTVAITPGDLKKSEAWWRIVSEDEEELMPPPESHLVLNGEQKQLIRRWIEEGAEYEGHWAYASPAKATPPEVSGARNEIDQFIIERLEEEGLKPSEEAEPRTLIRRLSLDLVGLPPTRDEVESFVSAYAEESEVAWQREIDRLLASPHFGERMAVPWLDQARYADTNGYSIDGGRHMWLWRDWVIQSYNENKAYNDFVTEQLAGDLLPNATPAQVVATGFNRNHMITHEGGTIPEENLNNYAADRVKTTSEVFLGLTMACAQCHDHKYDPISTKEYYEFFSFFNELSDRGLDGNAGNNAQPNLLAESVIPDDELPELQSELTSLQQEWETTTEGFSDWLTKTREEETKRGADFRLYSLKTLDVSSPNRPGPYEVLEDGSVYLSSPSRGLNAFSHAFQLPAGKSIDGIRIGFRPDSKSGKLSPHEPGVPMVTTVLVSAGTQPAKQVEIYNQKILGRATASSAPASAVSAHVIDERNLHWWQPEPTDELPHLTLTFAEPVKSDENPFVTVMVFFGRSGSLPHHWQVEAFSGADPDSRFLASVSSVLAKPDSEWVDQEKALVLEAFRKDAKSLEALRIRIENLKERVEVLTGKHSTMVMNAAPKPRETFVLNRGQYDAPVEKVSSRTPAVLPPLASAGKATRLDLAKWMTDPENPLTARVAVNRIWQTFFGTGIVATTADFGSQGEWPSHPELLDWLARDFVECGWDQKALIRKIVSSATYRQRSHESPELRELDPNNRLLARGPRFRLSAEFVRDQALAVSGLLVPRIGGPSVQPYQPAGLWKEVSHFGSTPATKQVFVQDRGEKLYRRSLYTVVKRTSPHPAMSAFDAPNREMCITERGITNTPLQALVTLNDPQFAEAARVFAAKLIAELPDADRATRIDRAYQKILGRPALDSEINTIESYLLDEEKRFLAQPEAARKVIAVGESPTIESSPIEQAVWTQISTLLLNLSETVTRS